MKLPNIKTLSDLRSSIKATTSQVVTVQHRTHNEAIACVIEFFKTGNTNWVATMIEAYNPLGGSFRIQALKSWFEVFAGVAIVINDKGEVTVKKAKKWKGKRDADQLSTCKANPYYEWAEPEKPLKAPVIPASVEIILAKGLATGTISMEEIRAFAEALPNKAANHVQDEKVVEFANKFKAQTTTTAETEQDSPVDEETPVIEGEFIPAETTPALLQQQAN